MKRKLRCIAVTFMVLTMLFGSVIDYSYSNSNSSVTEQPAKEENVTTLDTQLANPNLPVVDNMTKPEYLETEKPNATSDKIKSEEQTEKVKQVEPDKEGLRELSEDNPDHLTAPGKANPVPRILDMKADPYLGNNPFKKLYSLRSDGSSLAPGEVKRFKTVEAIPGKINTFKVKLRIEAKDEENTNDIVLVIDTSGSMEDNDRMENAKIAAKKFVEQLLNDKHPKTRIALVTFSDEPTVNYDFANYKDKEKLKDAIDDLSAKGGTFTQAGLNLARDKLNKSEAYFKNIVLLSDGVPTYGYKIKNPDNYLTRQYIQNIGERLTTNSTVPEEQFIYNDATGSGKSMFYLYDRDFWNPYYNKYYNFGNSAIAEAGFAKNAKITIHSIAMQAGDIGQSVLDGIASPGKSHSTDNPTELSGIFEQIANSISAAMSDVTVNDPMGTGFEVKVGEASNVEVSQGKAELDPKTNTIKWNVGKTLEKSVEGDPLTHYAEMTYQVEVNDSILGVTSENGKYNTNNGATVSYTDINGDKKVDNFPEPQAEPLIIGFYKQIQDSRGNLIPDEKVKNRKVTYNMALHGDPNADTFKYEVKPGNPKVMVDIKVDGTYTFKEIKGKDNYASSSVKWETFDKTKSGESNNEEIKDFIIPRVEKDGVKKYLNTKFIVTNREKNDGTLTLTKVFDQNKANSDKNNNKTKAEYKVKVVGVSPYFNENDGDKKYIVYPEKAFTLKVGEPLTLDKLPYGIYTVTEEGYTPAFEDSDSENDGIVHVLFENKDASVKIINKNDAKTDVTATKIWKNGPEADHTAPTFDLYADGVKKEGVTPTITPEKGTADEFTYKWTDLPKYDSDGNEIVYSVKEQNVTDGKVTINEHTYAVTQNENNITNTYKQPSNGTVKVTKTWKDPEGKTIAKPDVNLTLYRKIANGTEEKVPKEEAAVKVVNGETTTAEWTGLKETDINGNPYTFIVKESFKNPKDVNNGNWTLVESTAVKEGKANITNNVKAGEASLTIKKVFINEANANEPGNASGVAGEKALPFTFKVTGPGGYKEDVTLKAGEEKVLDKLLYGEYKVEETKVPGFTVTYNNQSVTLTSENKTATVTVTNKNDGTDASNVTKTVEKVWVNGLKPAVTLELWRTNKLDGEEKDGKIDEKVASFNVPANASGDALKKTFKKLAKYDPKGNEYEYYAKEANVPVNYTSEVKGLTVTNTYTQPTNGKVNVTKTWKDPEGKTIAKPDVNLKLYRKIKDGKEEAVPKEEAEVKVVNGETTTAEWTGLKETDTNGNPYTFIVKESFKDKDDVNNGNWTLVESTEIKDGSANIINKVKAGEASLTIKKVFINEANANEPGNAGEAGENALKFTFKVTGPGGYTENVTLKAGEEKVLDNLLYGEYKVEETKVDGFDVSYKNQSVTLTSKNKTATVTVTNQNDGTDASNVTKTVEKVWNNGPKPAVTLELWRKSKGVPDGEKVNEFTTEEGKDSEHTFKTTSKDVLLAKYDAKGNEYEYYAKEEKVPENYTSEVKGLTVTNTYTQTPSMEKIKLTFDPNGGVFSDGSTADKIYTVDKDSNFKIIDAPKKDGYVFDYWKGSKYKPGENYVAEEDHTFVAQWVKDTNGDGKPDVKNNKGGRIVNTGDSGMTSWLIIFVFASIATCGGIFYRRKSKHQ